MQRRADHRAALLWVLPETADDHQARVQPHAEGEDVSEQVRAQDGAVVQALAQLERGQHRPPGMVLLGHRRAKHGRDAFTRRRHEGPVVAAGAPPAPT